MLISKKSPRKSKLFHSRFRDGGGVSFPLRQYLRCREDLFTGTVQLGLLVVFAGAVALFGRTVNQLFLRHGANVAGWVRWAALGLVAVFVVSLLRRAWQRGGELREVWQEMRRLRAELGRLPDTGDEPDRRGPPAPG